MKRTRQIKTYTLGIFLSGPGREEMASLLALSVSRPALPSFHNSCYAPRMHQ